MKKVEIDGVCYDVADEVAEHLAGMDEWLDQKNVDAACMRHNHALERSGSSVLAEAVDSGETYAVRLRTGELIKVQRVAVCDTGWVVLYPFEEGNPENSYVIDEDTKIGAFRGMEVRLGDIVWVACISQ